MSGYYGYSKSNNAINAEEENKYPITIATKVLAKKAHITQKKARSILDEIGSCEWHHTGKFYKRTNYYSVEQALYRLKCDHIVQALKDSRIGSEDLVAFAKEHKFSMKDTVAAYYEDWEEEAGRPWAKKSDLVEDFIASPVSNKVLRAIKNIQHRN